MDWSLMLRRLAVLSAVLGGLTGGAEPVLAQTSAPNTPPTAAPMTPQAQAPAPAATPPQPGATTVPAAPSSVAPAPTTPTPGTAGPDQTVPDTSISQTFELQPRPVIMLSGSSTWDEGFKSINDAFGKLTDNIGKTGVKAAGAPMAVFTQTDDGGFKFEAMIPLDKAPDGTPMVAPDVKFGLSPGGKVMKFQHRSAYDDIDSTYEAITAYLDEKGLEATNIFAEEYLNRTRTSDDPSLEVDIFVFLK